MSNKQITLVFFIAYGMAIAVIIFMVIACAGQVYNWANSFPEPWPSFH